MCLKYLKWTVHRFKYFIKLAGDQVQYRPYDQTGPAESKWFIDLSKASIKFSINVKGIHVCST